MDIKDIYNQYKYHEMNLDCNKEILMEIENFEKEEKEIRTSLLILEEEDKLKDKLKEMMIDLEISPDFDLDLLDSNFGELD